MNLKIWGLRALQILLIFVPLGLAAFFVGIETSSQPAFCGSCHFMKPYYDSWRTSTHKDVPCVECHIPPGIASELRKKYEALSMVVQYFTGTYGTNPWAEVPDQSCLRPGCHERRLLAGREVFKSVLFDHRPHLTEMRRKKRLRCTSCHSQIVQGQHITVTESTCFLCHFKGTELGEGVARCTLCHEIPEKLITTAGLAFDHSDVKRFGMECTLCHSAVVQGEGEVPQERCYTCHGEPERLARRGEVELLHRTHVTEHKVDCLGCHVEIQHRIPKELEAVATRCETCHVDGGHSPQRDLYVGIGGEGVEPRPAVMYLAGVSCESCHLVSKEGRKLASEVSCMSCHGAKFAKIYRSWQETLDARLQKIQSQSRKVEALVPSDNEHLRYALENVAFVEEAHPVHNPDYASALLWRAYEELQRALKDAGLEESLETPWPQTPYETGCTACHLGAEAIIRAVDGWTFRHEEHAVRAELRCAACHEEINYPQAAHGALKLECTSCHPTREELAEAGPQDCLGCHQAEIPARSKLVKFPHATHIAFGFDCSLCHEKAVELDHLELLFSEQALPQLDHELCGRCHKEVPPEGAASFEGCLRCHISF